MASATYTLTMGDGQTRKLTAEVLSPREDEDVYAAAAAELGETFWLDRVTPVCWQTRDLTTNRITGVIVRDLADYYPTIFGDWECVARIYGDTLVLRFSMLPGRGYWAAPRTAELRTLARKVAQQYGRALTGERVERLNFPTGFTAMYTLTPQN